MATNTIRTISPSTNQVVCECASTTLDEARQIAGTSYDAFLSFRAMSLNERMDIVKRALQIIQDRKIELGKELTMQMGRPIAYSHKEIETMQKRADYLMDIAAEALAEIPGKPEEGFRRWIKKEPVGPTLVIFAWNVRICFAILSLFTTREKYADSYKFPYLIIVNALIPALLAGNSVILKPSPQTPLVGTRIAEIFAEAGLPSRVLQVIQSGDPEILQNLVQIPEIKLVGFTGSTSGGLAIRKAAASRFIRTNLELGGNDPAYVRADADLKYVAAQLVDGAVFNSGQSCCAVERIYVHADVHDAFVTELQKELEG